MFRYVPFESKEIPGTTGVHTLYGIRVLNAQGHEIASVSDVSADRLLIDNLCGLCTNRQLSPIHLVDVIEDFTLAETLKNFVAVMPMKPLHDWRKRGIITHYATEDPNMKAQVYTFHIAYEGFEDKIWRTVEVSGNNTLAQFGYLILATFDLLGYHAFEFTYQDISYVLPMILDEGDIEDAKDSTQVKLCKMGLAVDEQFEMEYGYGCSQMFRIRLDAVSDMERGRGSHYPYVIDGQGRGILEDVPAEEFGAIVAKTDAAGKSDYRIERYGENEIWDYRRFDLKAENILLKGGIARIREGYEYDE